MSDPFSRSSQGRSSVDSLSIRNNRSQCTECNAIFTPNGKLAIELKSFAENSADRSSRENATSVSKGKPRYKCSTCQKCISGRSDFRVHVRNHTADEKPHRCNTCSLRFVRKTDLTRHNLRQHTQIKPFNCSSCHKSFRRGRNLKEHIIRLHRGEAQAPYKCYTCLASFSEKVEYKRHLLSHTEKKSFKCSACTACFAHKGNLIRHMRIHSGNMPYKCYLCLTSFRNADTLQRHTRTHSGYKPYRCSTCLRDFAIKSDLTRHFLIHTKERPHKCPYCPTAFRQNAHLTRHIQIFHAVVIRKPPDARFSYSNDLKSHIRTQASYKQVYKSDAFCPKDSNLKRYIDIIHKGEKPAFECETSEACFSMESNHIQSPLVIKPYKCNFETKKCKFCMKIFSNSASLQKHVVHFHGSTETKLYESQNDDLSKISDLSAHKRSRTAGDKPYKCEKCEACFNRNNNLKRHLLLHLKDGAFKCDKCNACFGKGANLALHKKRQHSTAPAPQS